MRCPTRLLALWVALAASGCASSGTPAQSPVVQPGAPGTAGRTVDLSDLRVGPVHTAADVHFMHMMIPHHAQALEMVALVPSRAASNAIHQMALRMEISQRDEIALIEGWLRTRGESMPAEHAGMMGPMHGMLTPEQMERLRQARGTEFDRIFLESMIQHHEGAITMVEDLFATSGAGQDSEIFQFATEVEVDQRMEIDRMTALLQGGG